MTADELLDLLKGYMREGMINGSDMIYVDVGSVKLCLVESLEAGVGEVVLHAPQDDE